MRLLTSGCLLAPWPRRDAHRRTRACPTAPAPIQPTSGRGFTLIEMIVLLMIIALLMALLLPTLAGARDRGVAAASLSNLRQHVAMFSSYANENSDMFPYVTDPRATYTILRSGDVVVQAVYFDAIWNWHLALAEAYYDGDYRHSAFRPPRMDPS